jgi:transposase InsO family protein
VEAHYDPGQVRGTATGPDRPGLHRPRAAVNTRWCGDITYIATGEGWLYLATVIDIASRRIVGHAMADHLRTELPAAALANAVAARDPEAGVIFHADCGCQYTSAAFARLAGHHQVSCRTAGPVNAGTTPWPKASSAPSRASCSTTRPGRPAPPLAAPSLNTSPGTTAPGCTRHWATSRPPNTKPPDRKT